MAESSHYSDQDQIKELKDDRPLPQVIVPGKPPLKYNNTTIEKQWMKKKQGRKKEEN